MQPELPQSQKILNTLKQWQKIMVNSDSRWMRFSRVALKVLLIVYFVFCAFFLSMRYIVLPQVGQYKSNVEKMLEQKLGHPVTISKIDASWYGFHPLLKLDELVLLSSDGKPALRLPEVTMELSWESFFVFDLRLTFLDIKHPELNIYRDKTGQIFIAGFPVNTSEDKEESGLNWVLKQNIITIHEGTIRWQDQMRDAPELTLDKLNFTLKNSGRHHRMRFLANSSITPSGEIDIRADFKHALFQKNLSDIAKWQGELYVALPSITLKSLEPYIDIPSTLKKGTGAVNAWIILDKAKVADLTVDMNLTDALFQLKPDLPEISLRKLSGRVSVKELFDANLTSNDLKLLDKPRTIELSHLSFETMDGFKMEDVNLSENYRPASETTPESTEIITKGLDLEAVIRLTKYLPIPTEKQNLLKKLALSGTLNQFSVRWEGNYTNLSSYSINGYFSDLSMNAISSHELDPENNSKDVFEIPGFKNLTGNISVNEKEGVLKLNSKNAVLDLSSYFLAPSWNFNDLNLQLNWSISAQNELVLAVDKMDFILDGAAGSVVGKYTKLLNHDDPNDFGEIDLTAKINNFDIAKVKDYVPVQTEESLRDWLSKAFEGGTANNVAVHLKGVLSQFPFVNQKESTSGDEFSVRADISNGRLNYAPTILTTTNELAWRPIDKINGYMTIKGSEIVIHADKAELNKVTLSDVDVVIPDMLSSNVLVNIVGKANGELQNFVDFTNSSPINDVIGGLTEDAKTKGLADLILKMQLPLSDMLNVKVEGTLQFADNDIHLFPDLPVLTNTQGKVHFSDTGFKLENIKAQFLGGHVDLSGGTENGDSIVKASGVLTAEGLQKNYSGSLGNLTKKLSGSLPYTLSITHKSNSKTGYPDVIWESDMKGFAINLPAPLGKSVSESRKLRVTANGMAPVGKNTRDMLKISYGNVGTASYERQKVDNSWQLIRGGIGINMKPLLRPGVTLFLKMRELDVNAWLDILNEILTDDKKTSHSGKESNGGESYVNPKQFFVQVNKLTAMDLLLSNVTIAGRQKPNSWQAKINSNELKGNLTWEEPAKKEETGKLSAHFSKLHIPKSEPEKIEDIIKRDRVRNIPAINIIVDNLTLFDIKLGHVELVANNITSKLGREWRINRLNVINPDAKLYSTGNWFVNKAGDKKTSMAFRLEILNAGKLLERLGYEKILSGGKGKMSGDINWIGLPYSLDIPTLSGKINLDIGKGQFLKVDPGMAKLLGVFSLQSLPRRLTLDFTDIFSEGFAFDEIVAFVTINNGLAKTENMTMKGVQATVLMNGNVDIAKETQDIHVAILPNINAGAASLAYSLINPAIGVGTFLAQLFLKDPLTKTFTYEYQITGSWTDPTITKIENKKDQNKKSVTSTNGDEI